MFTYSENIAHAQRLRDRADRDEALAERLRHDPERAEALHDAAAEARNGATEIEAYLRSVSREW